MEGIIAIGIIVTSTIGAMTLIIVTVSAGQSSQDQIIASNYAREGIEIVRGLRDSNWLKRSQNITNPNAVVPGSLYEWDDNSTYDPVASQPVAYKKLGADAGNSFLAVFDSSTGWKLVPNDGSALTIIGQSASQGYMTQNCSACNPSKYTRIITITNAAETVFTSKVIKYLTVTSDVTWENHGHKGYLMTANLYDWKS